MAHAESTRARADAALASLHAAGHRRTAARGAVLDVLSASDTHLTAVQIHRQLADDRVRLELSTVHRTLETLVELGLVHAVPTASAVTYGLADWAHHHAVCTSCGAIDEVDAERLAGAVTAVATASHLRLDPEGTYGGLVLYGRCAKCGAEALPHTRHS